MNTPEGSPLNPEQLSLEAMRETVFRNGWEFSTEDDISRFSRSYARVNETLEGFDWREAVLDFASVLEAVVPHRARGMVLGMRGGEAEITVELHGDKDNKDDVTQVYVMDAHLRARGFEEVDEARLSDWLKLKGEPGAPQPGTRAYYEQAPRAAELRLLCLDVINNYVRVVASEGAESEAMGRLLGLNRRLAELAIDVDMHADAKPVDFVNPVTRAERIAGILRDALQAGQGFRGNARAILEEHDMLGGEGGGFQMLETSSSPEALRVALFLMKLEALSAQLGADDQE